MLRPASRRQQTPTRLPKQLGTHPSESYDYHHQHHGHDHAGCCCRCLIAFHHSGQHWCHRHRQFCLWLLPIITLHERTLPPRKQSDLDLRLALQSLQLAKVDPDAAPNQGSREPHVFKQSLLQMPPANAGMTHGRCTGITFTCCNN